MPLRTQSGQPTPGSADMRVKFHQTLSECLCSSAAIIN
jgi:hypothetical protein